MPSPSKAETLRVVRGLLAGEISREDAATWAAPRYVEDIVDSDLDRALNALVLIDVREVDANTPLHYIYGLAELIHIEQLLTCPNPP